MTWDGEGIDPWLPERLAAEARLTAAERAMHQGWFASISRWLVKAKRGVFANGPNPDPTGVFTAAPDWAREMDRFVAGPVKDTMGLAYRDLFGPGYKFDARPAVVDHLALVRNRMLRTTDDVFALVAGEVAAGATAGASIPDIADRVARIMSATETETWKNRATNVARSETLGSLNAGRHDSFEAVAEELGVPMERVWISTVDARVRPEHALADGQRVALDEPFEVGGESLRFPGDPFASAANTVNCRCTEILLEVGEEQDLSDRQYSEDDWDEWNDARAAAPPSAAEPVRAPPRDLETEARQRQARIDSARSAGNAAAELDEVAANLGGKLTPGGVKALEHRIAGQVARGNLPPDVADDLRRALADGDLGRLSEVAWRHAESQGAHRVGRAGDVVPFDRKRHQALDGTPGGGTQVLVTRPGVEWDGDGGLLLDKARVDALDDVELFDARLASALSDRDALAAAPSGLGRAVTRLSQQQRDALHDYQGTLYYGINGQLHRGEVDPSFAARIGHLDEAMDRSVLTDDVVVYRGIRDGPEAFGDRFGKDLTGAEWVERRFVSTSGSERVARDFTYEGASAEHTTPTVMRLLVSKDTKGVALDNAAQAELLLQRGLRMRVVHDHGDVDGIRRLDVEVLPATKASRAVKTTPSKVPAQVSKLEIRDALKGTPAQLTGKFKTEWKRVTGRDIDVDVPPRASADTMREHYEGLLQVAERFPEVRLERVDWGDLPGGTYAEAITDGPLGIRFGAVSLRGRASYLKSLSRDVQDHWHPSGFGSPADIAVHEFGHLLRHTVGDTVDVELRQVLKTRAAELDHHGPDGHSHAARDEVSGYAATDLDELVAEALLDVMANGAKASRLSRRVVDVVEDAYKVKAKASAARAVVRDDDATLADRAELATDTAAAKRRVEAAISSGVKKRKKLGGGETAGTWRVEFNDGTVLIEKKSKNTRLDNHQYTAEHQADAEELAAQLGRALGARTPYVYRAGPGRVYMDVAPGKTVTELQGEVYVDPRKIRELTAELEQLRKAAHASAEGRATGLLDMLTDNWDRNDGNWLIDKDGHPWAIDHGTVWDAKAVSGERFGDGYADEPPRFAEQVNDWGELDFGVPSPFGTDLWRNTAQGRVWASHDFSPADMALAQRRLAALRPEFERLGRLDWYEFARRRLAAMAAHAKGTKATLPRAVFRVGESRAERVDVAGEADAFKARMAEYQWPVGVTDADVARARRLLPQIQQNTALGLDADALQFTVDITKGISAADKGWLKKFIGEHRVSYLRLVQERNIADNFATSARRLDIGDVDAFKRTLEDDLRTFVADKPIGVRVTDESVLQSILRDGRFRTSFEDDITRANAMTRASRTRAESEEAIWGYTDALPPTQRPIYGYVMPDGVVAPGGKFDDILSYYGDVQVVFKSTVRARTTVSFADSLDAFDSVRPSPISKPSWQSATAVRDTSVFRSDDFRRNGYIEAQVHGGVTVDDVQEVVFTKTPTVATQRALAKNNIPWRTVGGKKAPAAAKRAPKAAVRQAPEPSTDPPGVAALDRGKPPTLKVGAVDTNPKFGTTRFGPTYRDAATAGKRWTRDMGDVPSGAFEGNCTNVVMAFEMRMRGYRVAAGPLDVLDKYGYAAGRTFKELEDLIAKAWRSRDGSPHGRTFSGQEWRSYADIDAEVAAWDEGGRGFMTVGKHVFNVVKVRGKAQYIEAQYDATPSRNVTTHYKRKFAGKAKLIRLDDLVPTDDILQTLDVTR